METVLANGGRRPRQPMSDEQRKAMFARMRSGPAPSSDDGSSVADRMKAAGIQSYDGTSSPSW